MKVTKLTHLEIQQLIWEFGQRTHEYYEDKKTMDDLSLDCITATDLILEKIGKELSERNEYGNA